MKNYILGSICLLFLFACGGAEDSSSDVKDSSPKVEASNNDAGSAFIKEFSKEYMKECAVQGNEMGLAPMFAMLGVDYNDYCQCTLDEALKGETNSSLSDPMAETRLMMNILNAAESCMSKYM
tara:strand:- start:931 stop:1299 length:369 start_codon:yes stop_codon:yes gene_type:complete